MNFFKKSAALAVIGVLLTGCTNEAGEPSKQALVGLTGAVAGGVIGSNVGRGSGRTAAIIGGTVLGGLLGSEVGKSMDRADVAYHSKTKTKALEYNRVGTTSSWKKPDSGASGSITPTKTYEKSGRYCREYTQTVTIAGKSQQAHGTACRNPDGTWETMN